MGQSTDGLLFYGFEIPGSEDDEALPFWKEDEDDDTDWEDFVAAKLGIKEPDVPYTEAAKPLYHIYWDQKRAAVDALGVGVETHCSGDYPMYALAVKSASYTAYRGSPIKLSHDQLLGRNEWDDALRRFCELVGIEYQTPGWVLASYWG